MIQILCQGVGFRSISADFSLAYPHPSIRFRSRHPTDSFKGSPVAWSEKIPVGDSGRAQETSCQLGTAVSQEKPRFCQQATLANDRIWVILRSIYGQLAQLVEHSFDVGVVRGSSPLLSNTGDGIRTSTSSGILAGVFVCLVTVAEAHPFGDVV